jgi:hypothetical protein
MNFKSKKGKPYQDVIRQIIPMLKNGGGADY